MTNTCDTCRHWAPWDGAYGTTCNSVKLRKFLHWRHIHEGELQPDEVAVESDEGWSFVSGPKYGCIHWQAKG